MLLAIDSGNTRIKWALGDEARWHLRGECASANPSPLSRAAKKANCILVANVGGKEAARRIQKAAGGAQFLQAESSALGVVNHYKPPLSLGVDRWFALLEARHLIKGGAIVVCAGTAATIDLLDARGNFIGGLILPGLSLSAESLAGKTQLPKVNATSMRDFQLGCDTKTAIAVGAQLAIIGAALWIRRHHLPRAKFIIGGGDAEILLPHFPKPIHSPTLILDGIRRFHFSR